MADINVELDAYVIPSDHSVWKCFPGKTYRFYEIVRQAEIVFLDIRNLDVLLDDPKGWNDERALEIITAERWQRAVEHAGPNGKPKGSSSTTPNDKKHLTFLKGLLFTAKRGDLIVLPAEGYRKEVMIGELLDEPGKVVKYEAKDGEKTYTYLGRRVVWRSSKEKRFFSRDLIDLLHSQAAFFLLPKSTYEEVYVLAYRNFIAGEVFSATFETTKDRFSTSDNAVTGMWFNALASVREALERGEELGDHDYLELGLRAALNSKEGELAININSPGEFVLRSVGAFAIIAMTMMPLSEVPAEAIINSNVKVSLKAVGSANDTCALRIESEIAEYAKTLGVTRLQQHCKIGMRAKQEATIKTKARLK